MLELIEMQCGMFLRLYGIGGRLLQGAKSCMLAVKLVLG